MGILEYLSQKNHNTDFIDLEDKFKFIDDLSFIEIIHLISIGLCDYDFQTHVAADIASENMFLPGQNTVTQSHLDKIADWTKLAKMKLNTDKSKYMVFNFTRNHQFSTRLHLENQVLEQVKETRLLGLIIDEYLGRRTLKHSSRRPMLGCQFYTILVYLISQLMK